MPGPAEPAGFRRASWLALAGVALVALAFRLLGFERVLLDDGDVVLHFADSQYHARRALWILRDFPRVPFFDPYLNHPGGSWIPYPPLLHFGVAAAARLAGGSQAVFERIAALSPALLGSLAVVPIHWLGMRLRGPGLGLGAAAIYAVLPLPVRYSEIGYFDHHALVAPLGALLIGLYAIALGDRLRGRRLLAVHAGLVATRLALLGTWQGCLFYFGLGELALVAHAAFRGDRDRLRAQGLSTLATALGILPLVAVSGATLGGPFSAVELSYLHPLAFLAAAAVCGGLLGLEALRPAGDASAGAAGRLLRMALLAGGIGALLLIVPVTREGLQRAVEWLALEDSVGQWNLEQRALLAPARGGSREFGESMFGWAVYAIPLVPLAFLAGARTVARGTRGPWLFLALWSAVAGAFALGQVRYGNDFAPVGALGFALLAAAAGRGLARVLPGAAPRRGLAVVAGVLVASIALWPGYTSSHAARARRSLAHLRGGPASEDPVRSGFHVSLYRFAREVRRVTPPTSGLFATGETDASEKAEYSVLTPLRIGNALLFAGERPTPACNFGPYIGPENSEAARSFFGLDDEAEALEIVAALGARYVATSSAEIGSPESIGHRLHADDGSTRAGTPHLGHFRLVSEGPRGGIAVGTRGSAPDSIPYKLFERVAGAELVVAAAPDETVIAQLDLRTPSGRRLRWTARGRADDDGLARLRVPYASSGEARAPGSDEARPASTRAEGPYLLRVGERHSEAVVGESDVVEGRSVRVGGDGRTP